MKICISFDSKQKFFGATKKVKAKALQKKSSTKRQGLEWPGWCRAREHGSGQSCSVRLKARRTLLRIFFAAQIFLPCEPVRYKIQKGYYNVVNVQPSFGPKALNLSLESKGLALPNPKQLQNQQKRLYYTAADSTRLKRNITSIGFTSNFQVFFICPSSPWLR